MTMRTLVVTGASSGLGAAISRAATEAGYRVVGVARSTANDADHEMRSVDVSDWEQVRQFSREMRNVEGLYGLINAAGVASMNLTLSTPPETMLRIISTNLLGTMYCCTAIGKLLARRRNGRIINFSTIAAPLGLKGEATYVASKTGVEGFSRSFAREMADFDVTVNVVAPGPIPTRLIRHVPDRSIDDIVRHQIIQRQATPADVWQIISLLLEDRAAMVTGETIHVGGV